jgi:chromosome segregation ATPase
VKVYMDVSDPDPERIQQLEATAIECKEMSDHYMAEMIAREEDVCNLKNELEKKDDLLSAKSERIRLLTKELNDKAVEIVTAVSNAQHFIRKLSARDIEIRELNAKLDETETVIEDIRSDLQYSIDEVISLKDAIFRLERQLQDKDVEIEKTCSSAAPAIRQMNARDKTIRQLQAKLKQQDDAWKMENELLHCVILALRFVFSLLEVLVLFLWIFDYGCEEQARRTVFSRQWYSSTGLYWILTPP